ncbi:MAG TPA: AraC family transcriptional regulator, partial [Polyangiaceae bacterium]|nr:AraC family transcriptional regulator [Polyangiaceae bacterium]
GELERACRALADQASERRTLRDWCQRQGHDYERFRKAFQQRMGVSPGQYRIRRRLDRACQLLQATDDTIERIAAELGYTSPYEFSAQFSRRMGMPPSRYRLLGRPLS